MIKNHTMRRGLKSWSIAFACLFLCLASHAEDFRIWTDRNGNTLEARLIYKSEKQVELRDRKGKIHKVDPEKLSGEDQLYLNPPPPEQDKYKLQFSKTMRRGKTDRHLRTGAATTPISCEFSMVVKFLTADAAEKGLKGTLLIIGEDPDGIFTVLDKTEAPVTLTEEGGGQVQGKGCELTETTDEDGSWIGGLRYSGFLIVLYSQDGTVLEKEYSMRFLDNLEKACSLNVGDRFNKQLEKVE